MLPRPGIVIVGGGFAGFWAAMAARRVSGPSLPLTLVSRDQLLQVRPRLYEQRPQDHAVDLKPLLDRVDVRLVQGEAVDLDVTTKRLEVHGAPDVPFERLVVATGSVMARPPVPGATSVHSIDTVTEALRLDRRLAQVAKASEPPTVVVVGAGFTGLELALAMRDRLAAHGNLSMAERARVVLMDRSQVVGPELGPGPRPVIEAALADASIQLMLGAGVSALTPDSVTMAGGKQIGADVVVLTTGMVAAGFTHRVPGPRDGKGRLLVQADLRSPVAPDVFVAGDAAVADDGHGHTTLQSCQHALQQGRFAGENAARDLVGAPTLAYRQPPYVTCLDLGRSGAVFTRGWDRSVEWAGDRAAQLKRVINTEVIQPPTDATATELLALSLTVYADQRAERSSSPR